MYAAPGGKSFAAAVLSGGGAEITSLDISAPKMELVREGSDRMEMKIRTGTADATEFIPEYFERFDMVICDAPCSGLGVIRKKPDIRYVDVERVAELPKLQSRILANVAKYLKPGGLILYSTCTWREAENGEVVSRFLEENPNYSLEGFVLPEPIGEVKAGRYTVWPETLTFDGFFICLMRKNNVRY